jgi:REP element-mobilizing transposase RayT
MPISAKYLADFEPSKFYHVFNRSIGNRVLFREEKNYNYFLDLLCHYTRSTIEILAYCLIPNHFHLLIKIKDDNVDHIKISNAFRSFFIAYTNSINKVYGERGGLFQTPYRRVQINDDHYLTQVIHYIHLNPVRHRICSSIADYKYTSYYSLISHEPTFLNREICLNWFPGKERFLLEHQMQTSFYETPF